MFGFGRKGRILEVSEEKPNQLRGEGYVWKYNKKNHRWIKFRTGK